MNTVERTELIDKYLAGTMSKTEKNEFERLLLDPEMSLGDRTKLQDEMELQKEIIFAIRRRDFREHVQHEIAKIKEEEEDSDKKVAQRITPLYRRIIRATSSSAIAACFICFVVIAPQAIRLMLKCMLLSIPR